MKTELIPNEKQILAGIKKECDGIRHHKSALLKFAFALGEKLISAKKLVPRGEWEAWINTHEECDFSERQAQKYMSIAADKKIAAKLFPTINSIDGLCKALATVTDEQRAEIEAEQAAAEELKRQQAEQRKLAATPMQPEQREELPKQPEEPEPIEAEFTEIKPEKSAANEPEPENSEIEHLRDLLSEQLSVNTDLQKDNDSLVKIFEANDQLTQAVAEVKRLNELNKALESRINGLLTERNELIKSHNSWKRKAEKLEKQLGGKNGVAA